MILSKFIISRKCIPTNNLSKIKRFYSSTICEDDSGGKAEGAGDKPVDSSKKGLVIGVYEADKGFELTPTAAEIDQKSGGKLSRHLNELSCELKLGKAFVVTDLLEDYSGVAIASYGKKDATYCKLEELDEGRVKI
ncbi:hypothetical protein ACJJTC_007424 [Scirpophaga incertulas]